MDLTTATPVEIDTVLADLYDQQYTIGNTIDRHITSVMHHADAKRIYGNRGHTWNMTTADAEAKVRTALADGTTLAYEVRSHQRTLDALDEARARRAAVHARQTEIGAEFTRRGGWTRAYLVTDGHVHSSMGCSTCNNGQYATGFHWLVEFSGGTEADVVKAAADRACTICYPTAPVATAGPSTLMTPDERTRAEQRGAAAKAKAARLAKKIEKGLTADGSEFKVEYVDGDRVRTEWFKTEQAAIQWVVQYTVWAGYYPNRADERTPGYAQVIQAVASKHGQTIAQVEEMIAAKVAAKIKRDAR